VQSGCEKHHHIVRVKACLRGNEEQTGRRRLMGGSWSWGQNCLTGPVSQVGGSFKSGSQATMLNGRGGRDISSTSMSAPRRPGCSDARSYLHVVGPQCHRFATSRVVLPPTLLSAFSLRCSVGAFSCRSAGWCTRTNIAQTCSYISCLISNNSDPVIIHSCNNAAVRR